MYMKSCRLILIASVSALLLGGCDFSSLPAIGEELQISNPPSKTVYVVGESFDPEGMEVVLSSLLKSEVVTDYTYEPTTPLTLEDEYITVLYDKYSVQTPIEIKEAAEKVLVSIEISTPPSKLTYIEGESFETSGMVVKAVYSTGEKETISNYSVSLTGALTTSDNEVSITYEGKTARISIVVQPKSGAVLQSIYVKTQPSQTTYTEGDYFNPNGMVVMGRYSDGSESQITSYTCSPTSALTTSNKTITVSCGSFTATVNITVNPKQGGYTGYYEEINPNSTNLLSDLRSLNGKKRKSTVGYKPMLNDPQHGFYLTDPGNGQNTITSFYSGKSINGTGGLNREHVWPDSRGGNYVDNDIHMTRPTLTAENGNRGNSFYVEGKCSSSGGWDPAATSFGLESYRGDAARIIFYCVVASNQLSLVDTNDDDKNNKTMGKLSDLIKWNLKYPVLEREMTRNNAAEKLQGNRNPFIDHPELVCKIWGNYNSTTKSICGGY